MLAKHRYLSVHIKIKVMTEHVTTVGINKNAKNEIYFTVLNCTQD